MVDVEEGRNLEICLSGWLKTGEGVGSSEGKVEFELPYYTVEHIPSTEGSTIGESQASYSVFASHQYIEFR